MLSNDQSPLQIKLQGFRDSLQIIKSERKKLSPISKYSIHNTKANKKIEPTKPPQRFFHPKLEYIIAEVSNSPYLVHPEHAYSKKNIKNADIIRDMKFSGQKLRDFTSDLIPFDIKESKSVFLSEVVGFEARFDVAHEAKRQLSKQMSEASANQPPRSPEHESGCGTKGRKDGLVLPNQYEPFVGHTGKPFSINKFKGSNEDFVKSLLDYPQDRGDDPPLNLRFEEMFLKSQLYSESVSKSKRRSKSPDKNALSERSISKVLAAYNGRGGPAKFRHISDEQKQYKQYIKLKKFNDNSASNTRTSVSAPECSTASVVADSPLRGRHASHTSSEPISETRSAGPTLGMNSSMSRSLSSTSKAPVHGSSLEDDFIYEDEDDYESFTSINGTPAALDAVGDGGIEKYGFSDEEV